MATILNATGVVFPDSTTQTTAVNPLDATAYGNLYAGITIGDVGTYAFLMRLNSPAITPPDTNLAGSTLRYSGITQNPGTTSDTSGYVSGTPTGTWRSLGYANYTTNRFPTTLFVRIA